MASAALDITFPGNLPLVATAAVLRAVPSAQLDATDVYIVSGLAVFNWAPASLATDDGTSVIKPNDLTVLQAGRWISLSGSGAIGSFVPDLTTLKARVTSSGAADYSGAPWFWTLGDYSATSAADLDVNVVKANSTSLSTGAWVRQTGSAITTRRPSVTAAQYRTLTDKVADRQEALDYIPVSLHAAILAGTSLEAVASYIQVALSGSNNDTLWMRRGQYGIESEIDTSGRRIIGAGRDGTRLISLTPGVRSFFKVRGQNTLIDGLYCDASQFNYGMWVEGSNGGNVLRTTVEAAKIAGVKFPASNNNSSFELRSNVIRFNGRSYSCGNGTVPSGGGLFSITGVSVDPTALATAGGTGPRLGFDFVQAGTMPAWEVVGFTSNTITVYAPQGPGITAGTYPITLLQGSGVEITRHGDNSDIKIYNNAIQTNKVAGIDNQALYGVLAQGNTLEFNHYATVSGRRASGGEQCVINSTFDTNYAEANGGGAGYYIGSARQLVIRNLMADGVANLGLDNLRIADKLTLYDINLQTSGINGTKRTLIEAASATPINIAIGSLTYFENPSANVTVTVESLNPNSNASSVCSNLDIITEVRCGNMNTYQLIVRCADFLVNGVAKSGGYSQITVPAGSGRRVFITYEGSYGLRVFYTPASF